MAKGRSYWGMHKDSFNPWTLTFRQEGHERRYRAHFAVARSLSGSNQLPNDDQQQQQQQVRQGRVGGSLAHYKYSGLLIDLLVALLLHITTGIIAFAALSAFYNPLWIAYFVASLLLMLVPIVITLVSTLRERHLLPSINAWLPRHIVGEVARKLYAPIASTNAPLLSLSHLMSIHSVNNGPMLTVMQVCSIWRFHAVPP